MDKYEYYEWEGSVLRRPIGGDFTMYEVFNGDTWDKVDAGNKMIWNDDICQITDDEAGQMIEEKRNGRA